MIRTMMMSTDAAVIGLAASAQDSMSSYDIDGDGFVNAAKLADEASDMMRSIDADPSGGVSREEYAEADHAL